MKSIIILLTAFFLFALFNSCSKDKAATQIVKDKISGYIQKGPFISGTNITLSELNADLSQTGKTFVTQSINNEGLFQLTNVQLVSSFVQVKVDGFYFNEISNNESTAPITLFALTDISNSSTINVNIMTQLENSRISYLVNNGSSFSNAKGQAQQEVLQIFKINKPGMPVSETLNISQGGDDNAILLAVSLIMQGNRKEADLISLLSNISSDITTDGVLNDQSLGSQLINGAKYLDLGEIRTNLENKFLQLGLQGAVVPNFEPYINHFIDSSGYTFTNFITYPPFGNYGLNILNDSDTIFHENIIYSLMANTPLYQKLKITIKIIQGGNPNAAPWGFNAFPPIPPNWFFVPFDYSTRSQTFEVINSGQSSDEEFQFSGGGSSNSTIHIEYYENNSAGPTKIKTIHII